MGNMLRQVVAPLHERGFVHDPFVPVSNTFCSASLTPLILAVLSRH